MIHRFIPYPTGHTCAGSCIRCGQAKDHDNHRGRRQRMNWRRLFNPKNDWNIYS